MNEKIYIADDDEDILLLVERFLESEGYNVTGFLTGDRLFDAFIEEPCNLVILDIMMPGTDGLTICNKLRKKSNVPIILLTAKDTDSDYITGITLGSDDYLIKPFSPTILNMKVKALLRRVKMASNISEKNKNIIVGKLFYDEKKHCIFYDSMEIILTEIELKCLIFLMKHFDEAVSRGTLLNKVWGYNKEVESRVTDETIRKLRKKLEITEYKIKNKWGFGYQLTMEKNNEKA